jgi:DNA-binding NtrC family response regulator
MEDSILIVDDEPDVISAIKRSLMEETYDIHTANSGVEGLKILKGHKIKLVISDEMMPGMSGTEFLSAVKNIFPATIRIMLTGHASIQAAMKAVNNGEIYRFFSKPWDNIELNLSIRSAIEKYNLEEENRSLLKTVKRQASELKQLEKMHPGITSLKKDDEGHFILPEISDNDEDISEIIARSKIKKDPP